MHTVSLSADLTFSEAVNLYLKLRTLEALPLHSSARFIAKRTVKDYEQYSGALSLVFGEIPLRDIHSGHLRHYQQVRLNGDEPFNHRKRRPHEEPGVCPAGPARVNKELTLLKTVLTRAQCWTDDLKLHYEPIKHDDSDVQRALTPDEQYCWLQVSALNTRWALIHHYSVLAFGTCMSTDELRNLQLGNVNMFHRLVSVGRGKNKYRVRTIPLVDPDVQWSAEQLIDRAKQCGADSAQHYLFPFRRGNADYEPTVPMTVSGIKHLWGEVREASKITWFRPYDTRHTAITRLAEAGVPIDTIMSMAGHVSERMRQHYTHISDAAKHKALEAVMQVKDPRNKVVWPMPRRA